MEKSAIILAKGVWQLVAFPLPFSDGSTTVAMLADDEDQYIYIYILRIDKKKLSVFTWTI